MRAVFLALLMLSLSLAGCLESTDESTPEDEQFKEKPGWQQGDWWLYTFSTPQFGEDSARLVVANVSEEDGLFMLGISSQREAQRHAVINHNPFLGRITMDNLSVYENGEPQNVFNFPWVIGDNWEFTLLGEDWQAETIGFNDGTAVVTAISTNGHRLSYNFDGEYGFIEKFIWYDDEDEVQLEMTLTQLGGEFTGDIWFIRATDLKDALYEESDGDIYDTFLDSGHPSGVDFDYLVWYLDVEIAQGGSGSLTIKDHAGNSPLARAWGSGARESGGLGTIPSQTDEYSLTVSLRGSTSYIHLKVAGGIENHWVL
ncbi:MAG TPA: hypothetical protein EYQ73_07780 [Candidatus Poseidoniales archaeon]|nr:MAG: hypothetical protein CXT71_06280 [Euryarchaeota archaeon]HIF46670.1 hypothetical protein [Candidatus Poseidoniales archaeon]HIL65022.1 hypothetical protein [Candidatus Poseidoniales archaeon]